MTQNILRKLMLIAVLLTSSHAFAYDFRATNSDGVTIYYNITSPSNLEVEVTYYGISSYSGDIVIPETVNYNNRTYTISSIGTRAFQGESQLTNISIPNTVTSIGTYAFYNCSSLTSVTIPNSVTSISEEAFYNCTGLTSVTIGNSVTSIGNYAFCNCNGLTSITIPNSVTSIGTRAFASCRGLTSATIGNSVTSIGVLAFDGCSGLTSVTIGNSVTSIGDDAFWGCNIKKAIWLTNTPPKGYTKLSSKVNYVANNQYTSLSNVTIYPYLSSMFEVGGIKYVPVSPSERTCDAIDCAYDSILNINIENTVSFKGIEMTVKNIKPYTCYSNKNIKSVKLNYNGNVGGYAFYGCSALKTLTVNANNIGNYAFSESATEGSAVFDINAKTLGDYSFYGCIKVESITLIDGLISIGNNAFENCSSLKEMVIPNAVTSMGEYSFSGCSSLKNVTIGTGVKAINQYAFSGCSK